MSTNNLYQRVQHHRLIADTSVRQFLGTLQLSEAHMEHLLEYGAIYRNGLRLRQDTHLKAADLMRVHLEPKRFLKPDVQWIPKVLFEDEDLMAIDKPGGLPTHPTLDNFVENVKTLAERHFGFPLYITHRLDVPTQGVLLLAKTLAAQKGVNKLFRKRQIRKIYRAQTDHQVQEGVYNHYMNPLSKVPKEISLTAIPGWQECLMEIKHLDSSGQNLEVLLGTGRTHQIRAQLATLGAPIRGDRDYGSQVDLQGHHLFTQRPVALECFEMSFVFRSKTIRLHRGMINA